MYALEREYLHLDGLSKFFEKEREIENIGIFFKVFSTVEDFATQKYPCLVHPEPG
jgi:hypothetical protein